MLGKPPGLLSIVLVVNKRRQNAKTNCVRSVWSREGTNRPCCLWVPTEASGQVQHPARCRVCDLVCSVYCVFWWRLNSNAMFFHRVQCLLKFPMIRIGLGLAKRKESPGLQGTTAQFYPFPPPIPIPPWSSNRSAKKRETEMTFSVHELFSVMSYFWEAVLSKVHSC